MVTGEMRLKKNSAHRQDHWVVELKCLAYTSFFAALKL